MIDLHMHTTASDGVLRPEQLVERALERGLEVIAITDHDTTAGVLPALERARGEAIEVVPGIEVSANHGDRDVHVLGLFVDPLSPTLKAYAHKQAGARHERLQGIVTRLNELGVPITLEEVAAEAAAGTVPGRPHVARVLVDRGAVESIGEAFQQYLAEGGRAWVPYPRPTPREAFEIIDRAGGLPLIAHPGLDGLMPLLPELIAEGALGVEVYHPDHDQTTIEHLQAFVEEHQLLWSGGSDYHGYDDDDIPGRGLGETQLPREAYEALRRRAEAHAR